MLRLISAAVLAPLAWVTIKLAPEWLFCVLVAGVVLLGCWESFRMLVVAGVRPFAWIGALASLAILWAFAGASPRFEPVLPIVGLTIAATVTGMWRRTDPLEMLRAAVYTLFPVVFVGLNLSYLVLLRRIPAPDGQDLLLLLLICVILADTTAFYVGSWIGRRKLAPRISPNKSWEGAFGGLAGSLLGAFLGHLWFFQDLPLHHALILGLLLGCAAILGDLVESMVKRAARMKDSSSLIPGHGGVLDRIDSLLLASPVLYYYYQVFL